MAPLLFILHRNKFIIRPGELPQGNSDRLSDEEKNLIIRICTALGETTGIGAELGERVLSEDPWLDARGNYIGKPGFCAISDEGPRGS